MRSVVGIVVLSGLGGAGGAIAWIGCHLPVLALPIPLLLVALVVGAQALRASGRPSRKVIDYRRGCHVLRRIHEMRAAPPPDARPLSAAERFAAWRGVFKRWQELPPSERLRTPMPPPP